MESGNQNLMNMLLHGGSSENGSQQSLEGYGQQYSAPVSGHNASMQPPLSSPMGQQGSPYQMMPQSTMMQQGDMMSPPYSQSQTSYNDNSYQGYPGYTQQRMTHPQATSPMYYGQNGSFLSSLAQYGTQGRNMGQYGTSSSSVGYGHQNYYSDVYQPKSPASHQQLPGTGYPPLQGQMGGGGNGSSYPSGGYGGQSSMSPLQKPLGQSFFPPRSPASQQIHSPPNMTTNFPGQSPTSPMTQPMVGHGPRRSSTSPVSSMVPQGVYSMPPQRPQYPTTSTTMSQNQSSCMFAQRLEKMSAQHQYQAQMSSSAGLTGPSGSVVSPSRRTSFPNQQGHLPGMHPMKSTSGPVSPVQRSPPQIGKSSPPFKTMRSPPPYQAHKSPPSFQKTTMPAPYPPTTDVRKTERQPLPVTPEIGQPPTKKARKSVNKEKSSMQKLEEVAESVSPHLAEGLSHAVGDPVEQKTDDDTMSKQPDVNHKDGLEPTKEDNVTNLGEKPLSEENMEETASLKESEVKEGQTEETNEEKTVEEKQDKVKRNEEKRIEEKRIEEKRNEEKRKEEKIIEEKRNEEKRIEEKRIEEKRIEEKRNEEKRKEEKRNEDTAEKQKRSKAKKDKKESEDKPVNVKQVLAEEDKSEESQTVEKSEDIGDKKDNSQTEPQNNETPEEMKEPDTAQQQKETTTSPVKDEKKTPEFSQTQETSKDKTPLSDEPDLDEPSIMVKATDTTKSGGTQTPRFVEKPSFKADSSKKITVSVKDVQPKTLLSKTMSKSPGTKVSISRSGHPPTIQATVIAKGQSAQSNQQVLVAKTAAGQMYLIQGNVLIPVQNITVQQPNGEKGNKVICVNQGQGKSSHVMVGNITPNLTQKTDKTNKPRHDDDSEDELRDEVDGKMEIDLACREKSLLSPTAEMAETELVKSTVSSQTDNNILKSRFTRSEGESSRFHSMKSSPSAASKASNLEKSLNAIKAKLEQEKHNQTGVVEVKKRIGRPPGSKDKHKRKSYLYKRPPEDQRSKPADTSIVSSNDKGEHVSEKHKKTPHAINVPTVSKTTRQTKRPKMIPPPLSPTKTLLVQPRGGIDGDKWVCSFCGKPSNHSSLGVLYGPYKAKLSRERTDSSRECRSPDKLLSPGSRIPELPTELEGNTIELWMHKDCGTWSQGVYMLGRSLYGLEQAVESAASHKCSKCMELGATLQCFKRGCNSIFHFACARDSGCAFVEENFTIFCSVHK